MAGDSFEISIDFTALAKSFMAGSSFSTLVENENERAGDICALKLAALMRSVISGGVDPANSPSTKQLKGSTKSLVDFGRLFKSVTGSSVVGSGHSTTITVGVMRTAATANVARIVHEGTQQTVTFKQALLFRVLWLASIGRKVNIRSERGRVLLAQSKGKFVPLKVGTVLVVPPRPFALQTLNDPRTKAIVESEFKSALKRAFETAAKKK